MFGFGNSKQKKYKKALEEFLQKMMSVKDYFEIIQARGKGQSQMSEILDVKVSDTDYWAKEHFEEYKSRFSESNDPLADIELRLKNYSFIKKEMEVFINYAKELEMNLTQGFVDDYYATVATCKSLTMCNDFFVFKVSKPVKSKYNDEINKVLNLPKDIVVVEDDNLILWVYKSVVDENNGDVIDSLDGDQIKRNVNLFENKFFKVKSDPFTIVGYFETKNQALSFYNSLSLRKFPNHLLEEPYFNYNSFSSPILSETYKKEIRVSVQACSVGLTARKSKSFMVELTFNLNLDDLKEETSNSLQTKNVRNVDLINEDKISIDKNEDPYSLKEGMIREFILQKQTMSILPFNEETQQYKEAISYNILFTDYLNQEDYDNREPITDQTLGERQNIGINEIDQKVKYDIVLFEGKIIDYDQILDDLNDSEFEEYALFESLEETINFRDDLISNHLNEKTSNENELQNNKENKVLIYNTEDVRKLLVQLSGSDPEIKLSISDRYFGAFQLEKDLTEQEFKIVNAQEYQDFDSKKPAYTGTTIYREYECYVSKSILMNYLNEYIESAEFNEDEMDLDSFISWGEFEHGHSFEHELDCGEIKEVIDVQGKEVYLVEVWEMDEHRDRHMIIEFNDKLSSQPPEVEEKLVNNDIQSFDNDIKTHNFCSECGNKLLPEMKFCTQCGKKIDVISSSKLKNTENKKNEVPITERFQIESLKESFNKSIDNIYNKFLKHSRDLHIHFDETEYDKIKPILANLYYVGIKLATINDKIKKDQYQVEVNDLFLGNKCHERLFGHFLEENRSWNSKIKLIKIILMDKPDFLELVFDEIFTENNNEILELIRSKKFGVPFDDGDKWDVRFKVFSQKVQFEYSKQGEENIIIDNIDLIMYREQGYSKLNQVWDDIDGGLSDIEFYIKNGEKYNPSNFLLGNHNEWTQENYEWMFDEDQKTFSYHKTEEEAKKA